MNSALLLTFFLILVIDMVFITVRASMLQARVSHLLDLREHYQRRVDITLKLIERPHLRASLRLGVVAAHFLLAGTGWLLFIELTQFSNFTLPLVFAGMLLAALFTLTLEFMVEGEILRNAERWAIRVAPLGQLIEWLFRPFTWFLIGLLRTSVSLKEARSPVIEDELKVWVKDGEPEGSLEQNEREMIYSIFQFGDTLCREIMIPRIDVQALEADTPMDEAILQVTATGHSRVPVYDDNIDNIVGMLYVKDLLRVQLEGGCDSHLVTIRSYLRPPYFVPEAKKVAELLREMQSRRVHMVVVVDEYGGMAGLVTLEDIVEEIVGDIQDEYDQAEEMLYQKIDDHQYVFLGRIDLEDVNDLLDTHLTKEVADTLGGFIYGEVGRIPGEGEQVKVESWILTVEQVIGRRIQTVRARRIEQAINEKEEENDNSNE